MEKIEMKLQMEMDKTITEIKTISCEINETFRKIMKRKRLIEDDTVIK